MLVLFAAARGLLATPTRHVVFAATSPRRASALASSELAAPAVRALCNGTRLGHAVTFEAVVPPSVAPGTPLPEVVMATDPGRFPTASRARKALRRGCVLINGSEVRCISTAGGGDLLALQARVSPGFSPRGKPPFPVEVAYEDESIAVVLKPAGVCTHPPADGENRRRAGASHGNSMRSAIHYALQPPPAGTPGALYRPHICHRLDRPTSGLLLCAKTRHALLGVSSAFRDREVHKQYRAVVCGIVEGDEGEVDSPIMRRESRTRWRVLRRGRSLRLGGGHLTELALFPLTGRTHQLRRHCAEVLGAPIVGDSKYGGGDAGSGLYLSAVELRLAHPDRPPGAPPLHVAVEAPAKFGRLLAHEQQRWERLAEPDGDGVVAEC